MHDYMIIGGGIAGTILGYRLLEEGKSIIIIDEDSAKASWKVAGGVWNAISFRRILKSWMADEMSDEAIVFYREVEKKLGISFYESKEIVRLFGDVFSQNSWYTKSGEKEFANYLSDDVPDALKTLPLKIPFGAGRVKKGGFVNLHLFIQSLKEHLNKNAVLVEDRFDFSNLKVSDNKVVYGDFTAENIIFCEGYELINNPYFKWLPMKATKGEGLILKNPGWNFDFILNNGKHLMDMKDGRMGVGATFNWKELDYEPTEEGKQELLTYLEKNFDYRDWEVLEHKAGIRPTVSDRRPLVGLHPNFNNVFIFNGLGTKGVLIAPWMSKIFCNYLLRGDELPKEANIRRFIKKYFTDSVAGV